MTTLIISGCCFGANRLGPGKRSTKTSRTSIPRLPRSFQQAMTPVAEPGLSRGAGDQPTGFLETAICLQGSRSQDCTDTSRCGAVCTITNWPLVSAVTSVSGSCALNSSDSQARQSIDHSPHQGDRYHVRLEPRRIAVESWPAHPSPGIHVSSAHPTGPPSVGHVPYRSSVQGPPKVLRG